VRLGRPVRALAVAAEQFQGHEEIAPLEPRGPADVRRAIHAFNAMNARVSALLDQKDRMLGAIGHDLRTPLASIRIRAENMGPEAERAQLFAAVDEMSAMLEDILVLARTGRPREPLQRVDLAALADTVVEEFRELGHAVVFTPSPRCVLEVQPSLLRRALRNLVENGCTFGEQVQVAVHDRGSEVEIFVEDDGPGIGEDQLEEVLKPFKRLDPSRSRATGGAGLGLAIADAVALAHGGTLRLENRPEGGLKATHSLPRPSARHPAD
jgi:signal transduction histidine kinase